ncbi:hypothetical protein Tco_0173388 [Tanacetum coccineum]
MTDKDSSAAGSKPMTPFVQHSFQKNMRRSFVNEIIPFYENIKNLSQNLDTDIYTEVKEFERSLDKMESDYDKCLADNKRLGDKNKHLLAKTRRLQRVMTNLSNDNECFIADNIAKDICFFLSQEMHQEEHLDSDAETEIDDNTIPYHQYLLDTEAQNVPTEVSADTSDKVLDCHLNDCNPTSRTMLRCNKNQGDVRPERMASMRAKAISLFLNGITVPEENRRIIKERTTQKPDYVSEWCFDYAKQFVEQQLVPFYDHFKKHIQAANDTFFKEIREFEQIFDDLETEYEQCVLDNKNLTIEKKNLLIKNDCLIAECLEKDICSIVLSSDIVVPPSSNCLCEELRSACDREHTKVLELEAEVLKQQKMVIESEKRNSHLQKTHIDLQLKFQNYKQCIDTSSASNAIFEINKLRKQLQGKDDTIRNLDAQINIMKVLNVGSTEEHTKLQAQVTGKTSSGPSTSEKPKVLASGMYTNSSKYVPPPKRANWVKPTPLPKKKQVTFQEPPRTSNRPTQKPPVQQNKKPNVPVNLSTRTKPATESRKPMPKSHTRNHRILPSKSVNARRAADHNRRLNVVDHNQFVIRSLKSVNTKTPQAKHSVNHTKKVWKATRNHNVNTTKTAWRPTRKVVGSVKPQWKPTGRHFALYDTCPLTRIMEPIVEPLELTPSVSSSSKVSMISRFTDCKLSDRKAGSKGLSGIFEC